MMISERPEATASSTTYWINGLSTTGSISFGCALVAGRNRVPSPAAGRTALRTRLGFAVTIFAWDRVQPHDTVFERAVSIRNCLEPRGNANPPHFSLHPCR